jgi:glutathione S-transferase
LQHQFALGVFKLFLFYLVRRFSMLTFYYHPLSPIARRVWLALLEKDLPFEPQVIDIRGKQQLGADFLALNPFHHVPVLVDGDVRLIESLAILDYLDRQYPAVVMSPTDPAEFAKMRMVQMVVTNELMPKIIGFALASEENPLAADTLSAVETCLTFLEQQLNGQQYFGGDRLNLADIIAGATLPLFCHLGLSLQAYPSLHQWHSTITQRPAWQHSQPTDEALQHWLRWIRLQAKKR